MTLKPVTQSPPGTLADARCAVRPDHLHQLPRPPPLIPKKLTLEPRRHHRMLILPIARVDRLIVQLLGDLLYVVVLAVDVVFGADAFLRYEYKRVLVSIRVFVKGGWRSRSVDPGSIGVRNATWVQQPFSPCVGHPDQRVPDDHRS